MATFETVRVAAVQAAPVMLDAEGSVEKAAALIGEASRAGARLVLLPECFVSFYPHGSIAGKDAWGDAAADLWERMWRTGVDVPGPLVDRLVEVCREHGVHTAIGVNERDSTRPGTLWNTLLLLGPGGLLSRHRKLMPTHHERLFHGFGAGDDLRVVDTPLGRLGGLTCWENRMPLARYAVYRQGPQIWLAPTMDDGEAWVALARTIAIESGAFVASCAQYVTRADFPADFPAPLPEGKERFSGGGALVADPEGTLIAGPLRDGPGIAIADCDLRAGLRAKRLFDVAGHYAREENLIALLAEPPPGSTESASGA